MRPTRPDRRNTTPKQEADRHDPMHIFYDEGQNDRKVYLAKGPNWYASYDTLKRFTTACW